MAEPPHPVLAVDTVRHVGDPVAVVIAESRQTAKDAAEKLAIDWQDLPSVATVKDAAAAGAPLVHEGVAGNVCYDWHIGDKAATDAAFARATRTVRLDLTNNRLIPNAMEPRAAVGDYDPDDGRLHALYDEPEPACDPVADGRIRAAHPGAQAARGRAGCRRRVRLQDLPLCGRGDRHLGRRQAEPPGEVDLRARRKLHVGRARPRPRQHRRDGARRGGQFPRAPRQDTVQHGRVSLHIRTRGADLSLRDAARGRVQDAGDLCGSESRFHAYRPGGRVPRRGPARGDLPAGTFGRRDRARHRARPDRDPAQEFHSARRLPVPDAGCAAI